MPPIHFNIYPAWFNQYAKPEQSALYWEIEIYQTQLQMVKRWRRLSTGLKDSEWEKIETRRTEALVCPRPVLVVPPKKLKEKSYWKPCLGYGLFHREKLNTEIIAHESVHMAVEFMRRTKQSVCLEEEIGEREEALAWTVGRLSSQLTNQLYETGIWK